MDPPKLLGKVVVVTGGAGGIGRAICKKLAKEGASIGIVDIDKEGMDRTLENLSSASDNVHCAVEADISRSKDVENVFKTITSRLGTCSILVNNAGTEGVPGLLGDLEETHIDMVLNVNLKGAILMSNEFVRRIKSFGQGDTGNETRGCVVNMSSMAGKTGSTHGSVYSASKSGLMGLTKSLALEFPYSRIRCNAILPGAIDTPMLSRLTQAIPILKTITGLIPQQRIGTADEIANACLYLVTDSSSYVNGAMIEVAGGYAS